MYDAIANAKMQSRARLCMISDEFGAYALYGPGKGG